MSERTFIRRETTYGGPDDPFVKVIDTIYREGDECVLEREIQARGYIDTIATTVSVEPDGAKP